MKVNCSYIPTIIPHVLIGSGSTCGFCEIYVVPSVCGTLVESEIVCEGCDGTTDAGAGSSHVHPVWHRRLLDSHHLHEESGCCTQRQKAQETGLHISGEE